MIFPVLELEEVIQLNDKTRLNGDKSYSSQDEEDVTMIEIEPEAGAGFIDVTMLSYLDWQYSTAGTKVVSIRITTDSLPVVASSSILAITEEEDRLFSSDEELTGHEPNILDYVKSGRNSFLNIHRTAQTRIISWLDENGIYDIDGNKLTKEDVIDISEVSQWAKFECLYLIFEGLSNSTEDIFADKASGYASKAENNKNRSMLKLDRNNDGKADNQERQNMTSFRLVRR